MRYLLLLITFIANLSAASGQSYGWSKDDAFGHLFSVHHKSEHNTIPVAAFENYIPAGYGSEYTHIGTNAFIPEYHNFLTTPVVPAAEQIAPRSEHKVRGKKIPSVPIFIWYNSFLI